MIGARAHNPRTRAKLAVLLLSNSDLAIKGSFWSQLVYQLQMGFELSWEMKILK